MHGVKQTGTKEPSKQALVAHRSFVAPSTAQTCVTVAGKVQWLWNKSDNTGQHISKHFFVPLINTLLIYLFASMKVEKGHKKNCLALVLKLSYTMIFYEIG